MALFLDFIYEPSYSTKTIRIRDVSLYGDVVIKTPTLEIWPPGFGKVNVPITVKNINEYRAIDLGISCDDPEMNLPDGIYEFKYSIYPNLNNLVKKSFMYTNNIVAALQTKYLSLQLDCQCNSDYVAEGKKKLEEIKLLIEGSISAANQCDEELAYTLLKKAQTLITRSGIDCGCN